MKKLYFLLTLSLTGLVTYSTAQSDRELGTTMSSARRTELLSNITSAPKIENQIKSALSCDSLAVDSAAGNGFHGNMFDISVTTTVTLETFSVSMDAGTWNVAIFYKTGTYVGSESASTGWIFLDSANIVSTSSTAGVFTKVPVNLNLTLNAGSTYAFYVTGTSSSAPINYTNGTAVGTVAASNTYFSVLEGAGGAYPFSVTNSPRIFNGEVIFCTGSIGVDEHSDMNALQLFPNPAEQSVTIDLNAFNGNTVSIALVNILGQSLQSLNTIANGITTLDLDGYSAGLYFVQVEMKGKVFTQKLIVK